jgi:ribulose-phosphate 3-epimerase
LNKTCSLLASIISDNPSNIFSSLDVYKSSKISGLHFDLMDGNFVPRFGLYPEILNEIRKRSDLPVEVHMMTRNLVKYLKVFADLNVTRIIFHFEATDSPLTVINEIKKLGVEVGIAINPTTSLEPISSIFSEVDYIMLMAIQPGVPRHPFIEHTYKKITDLKQILDSNSLTAKIGIDGGVTFDNARKIISLGADILVCGSGTFFDPARSLAKNIEKLQEVLR